MRWFLHRQKCCGSRSSLLPSKWVIIKSLQYSQLTNQARFSHSPDTVRFRNAYGGSTDLRISNFTLHYRYKPQFDYHNMAVAFLDRDPRTAINTVKPACVLKPHIKGNKSVQLIGLIGNQLDRADLQTVSSEKCHEYYNPNRKLRFGVLLCCFCARNANLKNCTVRSKS